MFHDAPDRYTCKIWDPTWCRIWYPTNFTITIVWPTMERASQLNSNDTTLRHVRPQASTRCIDSTERPICAPENCNLQPSARRARSLSQPSLEYHQLGPHKTNPTENNVGPSRFVSQVVRSVLKCPIFKTDRHWLKHGFQNDPPLGSPWKSLSIKATCTYTPISLLSQLLLVWLSQQRRRKGRALRGRRQCHVLRG